MYAPINGDSLSPLILSLYAVPAQPVTVALDAGGERSHRAGVELDERRGHLVLGAPGDCVRPDEIRDEVQRRVPHAIHVAHRHAAHERQLLAEVGRLRRQLHLAHFTYAADMCAEEALRCAARLRATLASRPDVVEELHGCRLHVGRSFALSSLGRITVPSDRL